MREELKAAWTAKLRSGKIPQGRWHLHNHVTGEMCCLGVLCMVAGIPGDRGAKGELVRYGDNLSGFSSKLRLATGLSAHKAEILYGMNDTLDEHGQHVNDFNAIADWIDENVQCEE